MTTDIRSGAARWGAALAAALLAGCTAEAAGPGTGTSHEVRKGSLKIVVTETGTLKAKNSVNIKAKIPGQAKIVWLVPEGTEVKEGDKLAELDKTEVQRAVDSLRSELVSSELERKNAKTELDIQVAEGSSSVEKARLGLEIKQKELDRYLKSDNPQELRKKELAVEKAESEFKRKDDRYRDVKKLREEEFVTDNDVEEERIALRAAEIELQSAKDDLAGYTAYTEGIQRAQKESDLAEARRALDNEKLRAENLLDRKKVAYEQAEVKYQDVEHRLKEQVEQLEAMTVKAPAPGIVIYQERGWNNEEMKVGTTVYNDQPFLQLPDLAEMEVTLGIHEADVNKLKPGQKVFVRVDSFKGKQIDGEITKVATIASERDWRSDVKKFEVVVTLKKNELPLKPGLTAKVEILVGQVDDVLTVPLQSVFTKEGKFFVWTANGGKQERREVVLGESNDNYVVVREGVKEGDAVLLYNPEAGENAGPSSGPGGAKAPKGGGTGTGAGKP